MKLGHLLSDAEIAKLLSAYRIPMADSKLTTNANEAVKTASEIGYPVVLKVTSPDILHKTEAGVIKLGVGNEEELRCSYQEVLKNAKKHYPKAQILGITIYKMVRSGLEMAIGAKRDPIFGPFVMFSLGGIYIEILKDFQIRLAPVSTEEALEMIKSIKSFALLAGYRGGEKFDIESVSKAISGLSKLMIDFPQISEVDINPIRLDKKSKGILALDAKVIFNSSKNH
jgi:acyl-CoA synthetase (NDP forming)